MSRIEKQKREIGHLQQELAKRNRVIAGHNDAMSKLREQHSKELANLDRRAKEALDAQRKEHQELKETSGVQA